jgi:large subunit ribosomal protein L13
MAALIREMEKAGRRDIARLLSKPRRAKAAVNVGRIGKTNSEAVVVAGKVLSMGDIRKPVTVYAWQFSNAARLASLAAKMLLKGEQIKIINAENVIITGNPSAIVKEYKQFKGIGSPQHGPFYPRRPDMLVKRTVRGMLPKTKRGRAALKKLRVHTGNPDSEKGEKIAARQIRSSYVTAGNLAKQLGWTRR